jgi:hypothetical protein
MASAHSPKSIKSVQLGKFDETDAALLEQAVEKLVRFGQRFGVTPEEMISLLDSGIGMRELLAFLASKASGAA